MQIKQFEYVREIARQGSIKVAAEKLYISQQALSESVRSLEAELEFKLFRRTNRGIVPTEKCERFLCDLDTIMPIVYSWKEYKEKVMVKLLVQYVLSDMLLNEKLLQYMAHQNQIELYSETLKLGSILEEVEKGAPCLSILIVQDAYSYAQQLTSMRKSGKYMMEELISLEQSQMCILMQTTECPVQNGEMIEMEQLYGKTLMVNKDMVNLRIAKQIEHYSNCPIHGLPYTVKAVDVVAHNKNAITYLPKFIAERDFYVKTDVLAVSPIKDAVDEQWHCYLLYAVQWKALLQPVINEVKAIFAE